MAEHPILFSAPMIRAILDGRKTVTRRIVKLDDGGCIKRRGKRWHPDDPNAVLGCPYGQAGDTLWVRETWAVPHRFDGIPPSFIAPTDRAHYGATEDLGGLLKRPSIFMPRWASRITLRIKSVRVERLQDITEDDAMAEGCSTVVEPDGSVTCGRRKTAFRELWDSLNAKRGAGWNVNPFVWRVEFERVEPKQ